MLNPFVDGLGNPLAIGDTVILLDLWELPGAPQPLEQAVLQVIGQKLTVEWQFVSLDRSPLYCLQCATVDGQAVHGVIYSDWVVLASSRRGLKGLINRYKQEASC